MKLVHFCAFFILLFSATAQVTEGTITYSVEILGIPEEQAAMMKGMENVLSFKKEKVRMDIVTVFNTITIYKDEKGNITTLMEMMGQKFFTKTDPNAKTKKGDAVRPDPVIKYTEEKKTISGYECKKALVENKDEKGNVITTEVWYTDKLPYLSTGSRRGASVNFKGLKGAPMEFEIQRNGMSIRNTATSVSLDSVPDSKFKISTDGYIQKDEEEVEKMMSGGK